MKPHPLMRFALRNFRNFLRQLEKRPQCFDWLEDAPLPVREADARERRNLSLRMLFAVPCIGLDILLRLLEVPLGARLWLSSMAVAALAWPIGIFRLATAAHHGARSGCAVAARLRWLSMGLFVLGSFCGLAVMLAVGDLLGTYSLWL